MSVGGNSSRLLINSMAENEQRSWGNEFFCLDSFMDPTFQATFKQAFPEWKTTAIQDKMDPMT
jgi:hypothetical protein